MDMARLSAVTSVRCLGCGLVYPKPSGGGTSESNPGCPRCGYVGWVPDDDRISADLAQIRCDVDQLPDHVWLSG